MNKVVHYLKINFLRLIIISIIPFSITLAYFTFKIGMEIEGPTRCRDGSFSPSIGIRGACSHHGGVERTGGFSILMSLIVGSSFFWFSVHLFKRRGPYVILRSLPPHPFEIEINKMPTKRISKIPFLERKAMKDWTCTGCKSLIKAKTTYMFKYAARDSSEKILRYCFKCTEAKSLENLEATLHNDRRSILINETRDEIELYYKKNSIFAL